MGIDVYLKWENQTEEEERKQYTGFSLEHGHVGYLRASYNPSMRMEYDFLHDLWDTNWDEDLEYDFTDPENVEKMIGLLQAYESVEDHYPAWAKSIRDFFKLGNMKNIEGKKTWIHFSY